MRSSRWYKLVNGNVEPASLEEMPSFTGDNVLARATVGDCDISTVFLGLDHRHWGEGPPIVFETMLFGGDHDGSQWRYSDYQHALDSHWLIVRALNEGVDPATYLEFRDD